MVTQTGRRARTAAYVEFASAERDRLFGVAYLLYGRAGRAGDVVHTALARLYDSWVDAQVARRTVLQDILFGGPDTLTPPGRGRVELLDGPAELPPSGVVADLAALSVDARRAVVLSAYLELPTSEVAAVTGLEDEAVPALLGEASARLTAATGAEGAGLQQLLRAAVPLPPDDRGPGRLLADGRLLRRRRILRRGLLVAAVVLILVAGIARLTELSTPAQSSAPTPTAPGTGTPSGFDVGPPAPRPTCNIEESGCRIALRQEWRARMARVMTSYIDPHHHYFSGYTSGADARYDSGGVWTGSGGVLGLDLARVRRGATEVHLQIATSRQFASRCGQRTRNLCAPQRFMDGNTYVLTSSVDVAHGMEVQYRPYGDQVITVVARNVISGPALEVTRAQLLALVNDPRLRLPA